MSTVPPGTPCWADLAIADLADPRYQGPFAWNRADHAGAGEAKPTP
ncbi:hypothetical protein AB0J20_30540 [Micromonospora costi]